MFELTRTIHQGDFDELKSELTVVDEHFDAQRPQHPMRRWEYALALRAFDRADRTYASVADVGGAGSPLTEIMIGQFPDRISTVQVIDPDDYDGFTLDQWVRGRGYTFPSVMCISVLEHVEDLQEFLYHLCCLTAPGGLLFLTADYRGDEGPDDRHFHWMRKRIFTPATWTNDVLIPILKRDFSLLGPRTDPSQYPGDFVYDYTFVSAALVKRA